MFEGVLGALLHHGCRFVVVGSAARALCGESVHPRDLDLVADTSPDGVGRLRSALVDLGATVETRRGWQPIDRCASLPWQWGFRVWTAAGTIDLITQFIDFTTIDEHDANATTIEIGPELSVRAHPTRHEEAA